MHMSNVFVYHVTGCTYSRIIFTSYVYLKDIYKTLKWIGKLSKLEYYFLCGKVNLSVIHPTHITIYSFGITMLRGGSRTAATSKMEHFVIIVNGWKRLTIITKSSILDVAAALAPPLMFSSKAL